MLLNLILLQHGYPPLIIPKALREKYLQVMSAADKWLQKSLLSMDIDFYQSLILFVFTEFRKTYWNTFLV